MKTTSRILQFFCYDYFEDLLVSVTFTKSSGFLAGGSFHVKTANFQESSHSALADFAETSSKCVF